MVTIDVKKSDPDFIKGIIEIFKESGYARFGKMTDPKFINVGVSVGMFSEWSDDPRVDPQIIIPDNSRALIHNIKLLEKRYRFLQMVAILHRNPEEFGTFSESFNFEEKFSDLLT